jgi:uncharacterized delta-60 repeat protein
VLRAGTLVRLTLGMMLAVAAAAPAHAAPGDLDLTFGGTGIVITSIGASDDFARSVALQADGKIVAAGYSNGFNEDFAVVRYNSDGTLDSSFGGTGIVTTPIGAPDDEAFSVALQADGKIVAAGYSFNGSNHDFAVVRYEGGPTCGDGNIEVGEDCEDGNTLSGDCCSSTCQHEPVGSPCPDGDVCNGDETLTPAPRSRATRSTAARIRPRWSTLLEGTDQPADGDRRGAGRLDERDGADPRQRRAGVLLYDAEYAGEGHWELLQGEVG